MKPMKIITLTHFELLQILNIAIAITISGVGDHRHLRLGLGLIGPESLINITLVKFPRPNNQKKRNNGSQNSHGRYYNKRHPKALNAVTVKLLALIPEPARSPHLLLRLPIVQMPRHPHIQHVKPDRARHGPEIVQRGVVLEPEELGNNGEEKRPLSAEAEPDDHGGEIQAVGYAEGDQEVADARDR